MANIVNQYGQVKVGVRTQAGGGGNSIVTNGLILNLDAGNASSYPGTGTTWTDLSGQNNNATLINGVGYSSLNGGIMTFDGVNDYCQTVSWTSPDSFTLQAWVSVDYTNSATFARFVEKGLNTDFGLTLNKNDAPNKYAFAIANETNSPTNVTANSNFVFLSYTVNTSGSLFTTKIYENGIYTKQFSGNRARTKTGVMYIGANPGALSVTTLKGNIGHIMMYNRVFTDNEVLQNFNATKTRFGL